MKMTNYPSNSHRSKEEKKNTEPPIKKNVKKVATPVSVKPRSGVRKFVDSLLADDLTNAKDYIFKDVIIPTVKDTIWSIFTNSLDRILYPNGGGINNKKRNSLIGSVSYNNCYLSNNANRTNTNTPQAYSPDNIIVGSRGEAEAVMSQLVEIVETYGQASIGDLYEAVGRSGSYTDNAYGWKMIGDRNPLVSCNPVRVNGGYLLKFPKAIPLD